MDQEHPGVGGLNQPIELPIDWDKANVPIADIELVCRRCGHEFIDRKGHLTDRGMHLEISLVVAGCKCGGERTVLLRVFADGRLFHREAEGEWRAMEVLDS